MTKKYPAETAPGKVHDLRCADCGELMVLRNSKFGLFYGCSQYPSCRGAHGAHPDGAPLGTPAGRDTKDARIRAHAQFDRLWKGGGMSRRQAYAWMRRSMGLTSEQAHIGKFDKAQCDALVWIVKERLGDEG